MNYIELTTSAPVVMIEFFASWCPHCRKMMPIVDQIRKQVDNRVAIHQLDIDANQAAADEASVESIPTFLIYNNGQLAWKQSGATTADILLEKINKELTSH